MAKVPYVVDDVLGLLCKELGVGGWELLGGHYAFTADSFQTAYDTVQAQLNYMLFDDNDPTNDEAAEALYDRFDQVGYTVMYWSTEKATWY